MNLLLFKTLFLACFIVFLELPSNSCRSEKPPSFTVAVKSEMLSSSLNETTGSLRLQPISIEVLNFDYPNLELTASTAFNLEKGKTVFLDGIHIDLISTKNKIKFPTDFGMKLIFDDQNIELPNLTYEPHPDSYSPLIISTITDTGKAFEDENPMLRIAMPTSLLKKIAQAEKIKLQSQFLSFQLNEHQLTGLRAFAGSIVFEEKKY